MRLTLSITVAVLLSSCGMAPAEQAALGNCLRLPPRPAQICKTRLFDSLEAAKRSDGSSAAVAPAE